MVLAFAFVFFLAVLSLHCSASFSLVVSQWLLSRCGLLLCGLFIIMWFIIIIIMWLLIMAASLVEEHRL